MDSPEARLLVAVLQYAIIDYADPESTEPQRWDAANWLFSTSIKVMSMRWICSMISDNPEYLRERILAKVKTMNSRPKLIMARVDR